MGIETEAPCVSSGPSCLCRILCGGLVRLQHIVRVACCRPRCCCFWTKFEDAGTVLVDCLGCIVTKSLHQQRAYIYERWLSGGRALRLQAAPCDSVRLLLCVCGISCCGVATTQVLDTQWSVAAQVLML